jgi:ABC-type polysaccharide/polyol phosphate export permease
MRAAGKEPINEEEFIRFSKEFYKAAERANFIKLAYIEVDTVIDKKVSKENKMEQSKEGIFFAKFLPGLIFFSAMFLTIQLQNLVFRDMIAGITKKIRTAPVEDKVVIFGQTTFILLASLFYEIIAFIIGVAIIKRNPQNFISLVLILVGFCLFMVGLAKIIYSMAKTEKSAGSIAPAVIVILSLISGVWLPADMYPSELKIIVDMSPLGMADIAMVKSLTQYDVFSSVWQYILGLWIWGLILLIVGFRYEYKKLYNY